MANISLYGLYLLTAVAGGYIGMRLKLPGGIIVMSMVSVSALRLLMKDYSTPPESFNFGVQVLLGLIIGASVQPDIFQKLKVLALPILLSATGLICAGLILTFVLVRITKLDLITACLGTSPGGMSGMVGIAAGSEANLPIVMTFHVVRLYLVFLSLPWILKLMQWWLHRH